MTEKKPDKKVSSFFKKIQVKINNTSEDSKNNEDIYNDPSIAQYNFGNINLYKNELNINDELKKYVRYIILPYNNKNNPEKLISKQIKYFRTALTSTKITDAKSFQNAVIKYHSYLTDEDPFFYNLKQYEKKYPEEANHFFDKVLPFIIEQALKLPEYLTKPIPLLGKYMNIAITLNKLQVLSLLANQFLCIFKEENREMYDTPSCSFLNLLSPYKPSVESTVEKIRCVIHYFDKMRKRDLEKIKSELLIYQRVCLKEDSLLDWKNQNSKICSIRIDPEKKIEECENMLQVDFANWYLGGGVLGNGCVQEEIRFCINPELFPSMIFTQCLEPLECAFIMGTERFSEYDGYGKTFMYKGDYDDDIINENNKRTEILAIDASLYCIPSMIQYYDQYKPDQIQRELNKIYVGAKENSYSTLEKDANIATGNWGCGAFNGNMELKALIQVIAISVSGKNIYYCPFDKIEFAKQFGDLIKNLKKKHITTNILYGFLESYYTDVISKVTLESPPDITLFNYILKKLNDSQNN